MGVVWVLVDANAFLEGRAEIQSATTGPPLRYVRVTGNSPDSLRIAGGGGLSMKGLFVLEASQVLLEGASSILSAPSLVSLQGVFRWLGGRIAASIEDVEAGIPCVIESNLTLITGLFCSCRFLEEGGAGASFEKLFKPLLLSNPPNTHTFSVLP